ncbi:MAG: SGNH/GDSL hydrolase family protein [bacterium]|nr:SGNH/GDSL hydrolase family protein [bacterium]
MRSSARRRLRLFGLAVAVFALALELVLQLGAAVVAWRTAPVGTAVAGEPHVLCIGDSFTFGIGASSPERSYPAALERRLAAAGHEIRVINAGRPGRNSRAGLEYLAANIRPGVRVVCILLGTNDEWSRPERVAVGTSGPDAAPAKGFEWKWRTGELLALAFRFSFGSWHRSSPAAEPSAPTEPSPPANVGRIQAGFALLIEYAAAAGVTPEPLPAPQRLVRDRSLGELPPRFGASLARGDTTMALALAREAASAHPDSAHALALLAKAERLTSADPSATVQRLEQVVASDGSSVAADWLVWTLREIGRTEAARAAARARIAVEPASVTAWLTLTETRLALGDLDTFRDAAIHSLRLLQTSAPDTSARVMRDLALADRAAAAEQLARLLVGAELLDRHPSMTARRLAVAGQRLPEAVVAESMGRVRSRWPQIDAEFEPILAEVYRGEGNPAWRDILRDHLERMGQRAIAAGAAVIVLGYPSHDPARARTQADAARRIGARWLDLSPHFARELRGRERSELFIRDGHCTDAGYGLIADLVADEVAELLRR